MAAAALALLQRSQVAETCPCVVSDAVFGAVSPPSVIADPLDASREVHYDQPVTVKTASMCGPLLFNRPLTRASAVVTAEGQVISRIVDRLFLGSDKQSVN